MRYAVKVNGDWADAKGDRTVTAADEAGLFSFAEAQKVAAGFREAGVDWVSVVARTTEREKLVAVEMCLADGHNPYEEATMQVPTENPLHLVRYKGQRWELYVRDARLFLAGMAAITKVAADV